MEEAFCLPGGKVALGRMRELVRVNDHHVYESPRWKTCVADFWYRGQMRVALWDAVVAFFRSYLPDFERILVRPSRGLRLSSFCWVLCRALYGIRRAIIIFGQLFKEILEQAGSWHSCFSQTCIDVVRET